jgi:Fe-S cluster biogenesis protein NfuA
MIRPLPAPRFTTRARVALASFVEAFGAPEPVVVVELEEVGGEEHPRVALRVISGSTPRVGDQVERMDVPVPVRFCTGVGFRLSGRVIDFVDESTEGGVRGFLVRTAGSSGPRASAPPSSSMGTLTEMRRKMLESRIEEELQRRVNPLLAELGGEVQLLRLRTDGVAEVSMKGEPMGISQQAGHFREVVAGLLLRALPELAGVDAVHQVERGRGHPPERQS